MQALLGIFLQAATEQFVQARRSAFGQFLPAGFAADDVGENVGRGFADEGLFAGKHFEQDAAEGPDVGAAVEWFAFGLFGRHVGGGAENDAGHGAHVTDGRRILQVAGGRIALDGFGEAEVENFHDGVGTDFYVGRLQVAVNDAAIVRGFQAFSNLAGDGQRIFEFNAALP